MPTGIYIRTAEHNKKIGEAKKGKSNGRLGKKHSKETKRKMSEAQIGENNPNWKGGSGESRKRTYNKLKNNLKYQLNKRIAIGIWQSLKGNKNGRTWQILVDYNIEQLKNHLQNTLPYGYTWQDFMNGDLHIDHIIPVSIFNFENPEHLDFKRCWNLNNLRLLTKEENNKKRAKLIKPFQLGLTL